MASTPLDPALESNDQEPPEHDEIRIPDGAERLKVRPNSTTSRSRHCSPSHSSRLGPSRLSSSDGSRPPSSRDVNELGFGLLGDQKQQTKVKRKAARSWYCRKRVKRLPCLIGFLGFFFLVNWIILSRLQDRGVNSKTGVSRNSSLVAVRVKTVKVSNVSLGASERDIREFFSFSGDIEYVEMQSDNERSQIAYVTFKDSEGAETAVLLSGATIVDLSVTITLEPDCKLPFVPSAPPAIEKKTAPSAESSFRKAEDVVSSMLAKGFILGKDAVNKAKAFDEKHQLSSTTTAKVTYIDQKIGFSEKISIGASLVSDKVRELDQKFQVSEKTKSAFAVAEQKVSSAGSAIMKNRYVLTGASWLTGAFSKVAKAAEEVGLKTKEKVGVAEEEQKRKVEDGYASSSFRVSKGICTK